MVLLGGPYTLKLNEHVRVDLVYSSLIRQANSTSQLATSPNQSFAKSMTRLSLSSAAIASSLARHPAQIVGAAHQGQLELAAQPPVTLMWRASAGR